MSKIVLYAAPGTCARVAAIALEEIGLEFEYKLVRFMRQEQKTPEYKRVNPKGRVPALVIDEQPLTENVAILLHLNNAYPDTGLLPEVASEMEKSRQIADLAFCASSMHPVVARIRVPHFIGGKEASQSIYSMACKAMDEYSGLVEERLAQGTWWYGDQWSVMDAYIYWIFWRVQGADYDLHPYPGILAHASRMEDRPAVQRALVREQSMHKQLEHEGLSRPFDDLSNRIKNIM